jgi:hypothetical protein
MKKHITTTFSQLFILFGTLFLGIKPALALGKNWMISCGSNGVETALGCFDAKGSFIQTFLKIGFGMAGGIAFLLILYGGLQMVLSVGSPEKLNEAKEVIISAIVGLLFVLFSVFLLKFIGVTVFQLPGMN